MDRGEEAVQRFEPAESIEPERDDGGGRSGAGRQHLQSLAVAQIKHRMNAFLVDLGRGGGWKAAADRVLGKAGWR